jgi:hypothetical protein
VAEFNLESWLQNNPEDNVPCVICDSSDQEDVLLLCDHCDAAYHTHCVGLDGVPEGNWFCMECSANGEYERAILDAPRRSQFQPRTTGSQRLLRDSLRSNNWFGPWTAFSNRVHQSVGLDLDFADMDDTPMISYRELTLRRRSIAEQVRLAERRNVRGFNPRRQDSGATSPARSHRRVSTPPRPAPSAEETDAWGALERAKEADAVNPASGKRKAKSRTATPEPTQEPERKLKRPRTRRVLDTPGPSTSGSTTQNIRSDTTQPMSPVNNITDSNEGPSFLSSLLREVEAAPSDDESSRYLSTEALAGPSRVTSPPIPYSPISSPSPVSSAYHTPRAMSITPPPHITQRAGSPLPRTSRIIPNFPPADYPERPVPIAREEPISPQLEIRQPRPRQRPVQLARSPDASPVRETLSIEAKEGINKIVKSALGPHWKSCKVTKDQYITINRDVSRKLYEMVADSDILRERSKWENIASAEVAMAVGFLEA